jgi:hypothetical protein
MVKNLFFFVHEKHGNSMNKIVWENMKILCGAQWGGELWNLVGF